MSRRRGAPLVLLLACSLGTAAPLAWMSACTSFSSDAPAADTDAAGVEAGAVDGPAPEDAGCSPATLGTDPRNCGVCGHDCRGAPCQRGMCVAEVAATSPLSIRSLTLTSTDLYFTTDAADAGLDAAPSSAVVRWPLTGAVDGGALVAAEQSQPTNVRLDGDALYWVDKAPDRNRVLTCARDACVTPAIFFQGPPQSVVTDVRVDDGHRVYILMDEQPISSTVVEACSPEGCPDAGSPAFARTFNCGVTNLVIGEGALYWSDGDVQSDCPNGTVDRCPLTGCSKPDALVAGLAHSVRVAASAGGVFYAQSDGIQALSFPTFAPTAIVPLTAVPVDLGADDASVYWIEGSGFVRRVGATGGTPLTLADRQTSPHALAVGADHVYWVAANPVAPGDVVLRTAK